MLAYNLTIKKSGNVYCYRSAQFPELKGFGNTDDEAFSDLLVKVRGYINECIMAGKTLPETDKNVQNNKLTGSGSFSFALLPELTMRLHSVMMEKNITRPMLARLLALTSEEVDSEGWNLNNTTLLVPKHFPKYKKVQRLLDINHDSSINEMYEAFRVLDCVIDISILSKHVA